MTISKYDDVIDSRDIIERIEELQDSFSTCQHCGEGLATCDGTETRCPDCEQETEFDQEEVKELAALLALQEEAEGYAPDWQHGAQLIRDSHFAEYAEELCEEVGEIPTDLPWYITNHIDWQGVARELQMDYTAAEFDGVTYWVR